MKKLMALITFVLVFAVAVLLVSSHFPEAGPSAKANNGDNSESKAAFNTNIGSSDDNTLDTPNQNSDNTITYERVIDPDKPMVAISFDDGPCPPYSDEIMDIFVQYHSLATFFEVGNRAEKYPEIIAREDELGFEVGSHTYTHADLSSLSDKEAKEEIDKANDVFISIIGRPASLLRPPYGNIGDKAWLASVPIVNWSVDTLDWESKDADSVFQAVKDEGNLDGKVILMHSLYPSTVEAVRQIVPYLIENGYQLVTISELAEYKHGESLVRGQFYGYNYFR